MISSLTKMTPELWQRLKPLFHAALDCDIGDREAFISESCGDDAELKENLARLVHAAEEPTRTIDGPLVRLGSLQEARFHPGELILGRFSIVRQVGSGGMGEVYEAWDAELREVVALKTIRPEIASNASVIEHFKEEVKQSRQISHPNICRVYDLFSHGELPGKQIWFLTMQFLEGRTLQERLRQEGRIPAQEAFVLIEQMIAGLAAAHELGVVHRDFKSANVMLVPSADKKLHAVIMDFGLATRVSVKYDPLLLRGQGTPAYVAPEQWREGIAGPAADQYSLGMVMCEMITGEVPVRSHSNADQPFPSDGPLGALSGSWEKAVRRCLELHPEDRFGSVSDILTALDPRRRRRPLIRLLVVAACASLLVAAVLLGVAAVNRKPTIRNLKQLTPDTDLSSSPSLSWDGTMIAYASDRSGAGGSDIWMQHLPDGIPTQITNDAAGNDEPSISPDGRTVAFSSPRDHGGIYTSNTDGTGEKLLIPNGKDPRFSPDGRLLLYWTGDYNQSMPSGSIYIADLANAKSIPLATGFADAREAIWNSDGSHILFKGCPSNARPLLSCLDWWITTRDGATPINTGAMAILAARKMRPINEPGGWYGNTFVFTALHGHEEHLWELTISPTDGTARGEPRELTPGDARLADISSSLAADNVLALTELISAIHVWRIDHGTKPLTATASKVTHDAEMDLDPSVSTNGQWMTFARGISADRGIWVRNKSSGKEEPFPAAGPDKFSPVIDDSGSIVAYESWDSGVPSVFMARRDGSKPVKICTGCQTPTGFFNGNEGLLMTDATASQVEMYRPATGELQTVLATSGARVAQATWSPANEYILFTSSVNHGNVQAFASRFRRTANGPDSHWIALTSPSESVRTPRWSGDGKTVYYLSNRDNSLCLWARHFDPGVGRPVGKPFIVQHFHSLRFSPFSIVSHDFNLSVAGDTVYLNVAEMTSTIWIGKLDRAANPFSLGFSRFY